MDIELLQEKEYKTHLRKLGCSKEEIVIVWSNIERRRGIRDTVNSETKNNRIG